MKIKLVNETMAGQNTVVTDANTGRVLDKVAEVAIHPIRPGGVVTADLQMYIEGLAMLCEANVVIICPQCGCKFLCMLDGSVRSEPG